jgi:SAM-dependent methyltransferase
VYKNVPNAQRDRQRLEEVLAYKSTGSLLEVGCGRGGFLKLADEHFEVEGIDVSEYAISSIKGTFGNRVKCRDIEAESAIPGRYDVVAIFNVLEHLKRPGAAIGRIHQGLRDDGLMVGSVPLNAGPIGRMHTFITNLFDKTHRSTFSPPRWRVLFKRARFGRIRFFGEIMVGRNFGLYIRNKIWRYTAFNLMFVCEK